MGGTATNWIGLISTLLLLGGAATWILAALLDRSGPIRLRHWTEEAGGRLRSLYEQPRRFELFRAILNGVAGSLLLLGAGTLLVYLVRVGGVGGRALGVTLVAAIALLWTAELTSRFLAALGVETILRRLTLVYQLALLPWVPLIALLGRVFPKADPLDDAEEDDATVDEIEAFLTVGAEEGILEPEEGDIIQRVIGFSDARVKSVMTPRMDMVCAPIESGLDELIGLLLESHHSRIPLYRGSVDRIAGILHIRDLLAAHGAGEDFDAAVIVLPAYVVPETKPLDRLLREFQARHQHMAIVVDEYGGTSGLVTVEDLLEEIVGEIVDEHDDEGERLELLPDGSWRVDGRAELSVMAELFDSALLGEPYESVGGLIFGTVGSVPEPGAMIEIHSLRFTVETVADRRIQTLRLERIEEERDR